MSAAAANRPKMTEEEYLAFERASEEKHEFVDGEVFAMAGCNRRHDRIAGNMYRALGNALAGSRGPCEPFTSDMKVRVPSTGGFKYPDVSVACEPAFLDDTEDVLLNPCVLVEVLSDSTEAYDRGRKFRSYRSIPSFQEYVLVSQHEILVEHYYRQPNGTWTLQILPAGETLRLGCAPVEIAVQTLYEGVSLSSALIKDG